MLQCDISSSGEAGQKTARGKVHLLLAYSLSDTHVLRLVESRHGARERQKSAGSPDRRTKKGKIR